MVNLTAILGPILGGLISGFIGLGIAEYRYKKSEVRRKESWYDKTIRLAERVENANPSTDTGGGEGNETSVFRTTCAGVHSKLATHISEAPRCVSSGLASEAQQLVGDCQTVKEKGYDMREDFINNEVKIAVDQAKNVKEKAKSERGDLGGYLL